jgi:hypothetical protein
MLRTALIPHKRQAYQDMFKRIMNSSCQNHGFVVTHLTKDCLAYHKRVVLEAERRIDQEWYLGYHDNDQGLNVTTRSTMLIFDSPQAYQDQRLQKLTHRRIYTTAPVALLYLRWSERPITYDRTDHPDRVVVVG